VRCRETYAIARTVCPVEQNCSPFGCTAAR
jgi:hypothetical protein